MAHAQMSERKSKKSSGRGSRESLKNLRPEEILRLEVLSSIGKRVNTPDSFSETLQAVLDSVVESLEAEKGALFLSDKSESRPTLSIWVDRTQSEPSSEFRYSTTVVEKVWREQKSLAEVDAQENEILADRRSILAEGIRSVICVPLIGRLSKLGVLYLDNTISSAFTPADLQMLDVIADLASTALERARFFEDLQNLNNELERRVEERTAEAEAARVEAERATRAKSMFLAKMSHELRTPLNGILGLTEDLQRREDDPTLRFQLDQVVQSARSLANMINGVLDFSKLESEETPLDIHPFELEKAVVEALSTINYAATQKGLELQVWIDESCPVKVESDSVKLKQILINLLSNAVKFTRSGWIRLIVHAPSSGQLQFSVADSGIGIAPEKQADIFRPFSQADTSTTREFGGTGLGLSISRSLCRLLGGELFLESTAGHGSRFTFQVAATFLDPFVPPVFSPRKMAVLVESQPLRQALERVLKSWGAAIVGAEEAEIMIYSGSTPRPGIPALRLVLPLERVEPSDGTIPHGYLLMPVVRSALVDALKQLLEPALPPGEVKRELASPNPPRGSCVLVVEDHEINQLVINRMLEGWGYQPVFADNGQEAAEYAESRRPRIVFMDIEMPGQDGYQTALELRGKGFLDVPIIAVTAHMAGDLRERCLAAGMDDLVGKPLSRELLGRRLALWESVLTGETPRQHARYSGFDSLKDWPRKFLGPINSSLSSLDLLLAQEREAELEEELGRLKSASFSAGLFAWGARLVQLPRPLKIQDVKAVFESFRQDWPGLAPTLVSGSTPGN